MSFFVGAIIAVVATVASMDQQRKAAGAQRRANELRQRKSDNAAQRARIAQMREGRLRRASVMSSLGGAGQQSSGVTGSLGSITSQRNSNIGFINETQMFGQAISAANQQAADHMSRASTWGSVAQLAGSSSVQKLAK